MNIDMYRILKKLFSIYMDSIYIILNKKILMNIERKFNRF